MVVIAMNLPKNLARYLRKFKIPVYVFGEVLKIKIQINLLKILKEFLKKLLL